jgi:hypothetical protein
MPKTMAGPNNVQRFIVVIGLLEKSRRRLLMGNCFLGAAEALRWRGGIVGFLGVAHHVRILAGLEVEVKRIAPVFEAG